MIAIYCRISVDRENQKSIKEQELLGIEFANTLKMDYQTYIDKGISGGGDISKRPAFERMINNIQDGLIKAVYVWNQDRTEREEVTWFTLANLIVENNIDLYENGKLIDLNDPTVYFMRGMMSQMNALYRRTTSKKIKAVLKRNASEGKAHSSILPYGYTKDEDGYLSLDEEEAEIVRRIYAMSLKGIGTRSIAEILNNEGVKTRYNKIGGGTISTKNKYTGKISVTKKTDIKWAGNTIRGIIKNPIYKGQRQFGGNTYDVPSIVKKEYWKKVNENLSRNANNSGKKVDHKYLLKGLLICGRCGRNYYGRTRVNKKDNYYMCSSKRLKNEKCGNRSINIDVLENLIWQRFFKTSELYGLVKDHVKESSNETKVDSIIASIKRLEEKDKGLERERQNAVRLAIKKILTEKDIESELSRIENERKDLAIRLRNLQEQQELYLNAIETISEMGKDFEELKGAMSFIDKQKIIQKYIKNITISYSKESNETKGWYELNISFHLPELPMETYLVDYRYSIAINTKQGYRSINLDGKPHYNSEDLIYLYNETLNTYDIYPIKDLTDYDDMIKQLTNKNKVGENSQQ